MNNHLLGAIKTKYGYSQYRNGGFTKRTLRELQRFGIIKRYGAHEMIYFPGGESGKMFFIISGAVKLYQLSNGRKIVLRVLEPGEFFGDFALVPSFGDVRDQDYAEAQHSTAVCVIGQSDVEWLLDNDPSFARTLLAALQYRLHEVENKLKDIAISSAQEALLNELVRYAVHHGERDGEYYRMKERISHQSLADMIGVARETVTKSLGSLQKLGVIEFTPERFIKLNIVIVDKQQNE